MNGKEFIEQNGLEPGTYRGQDGEIEISPLDLSAFEAMEFTPEEVAKLAAEKNRELPRFDLIDDAFIETAAKLGDIDLDAVKTEFSEGLFKGMEDGDVE